MIYLIIWLPIIGFLSGSLHRKYVSRKTFDLLEAEIEAANKNKELYKDETIRLTREVSRLKALNESIARSALFDPLYTFQSKNDSELVKKLKERIIIAEKKLMDNGLL